VGGHDDTIYVYAISDESEYSLHWTAAYGHSSAIVGLDWSRDSRFIRAVDQAYSKLYHDVENMMQVIDGQSVLTHPSIWQTATCRLGWDVNGVYPPGADGTDINTVDSSSSRRLVAAGDDFGSVRLFNYPVMSNDHECIRMSGHSEHVTSVRFYEPNQVETYLISAGGYDQTYIQWKQVGVAKGEEDDVSLE